MPGLLQLGQVSLALAILYVVYLIIRAVAGRTQRIVAIPAATNGQKTEVAVLQERVDNLEEELKRVRDRQDELSSQLQDAITRAFLVDRRGFPRS